MVSAASILQKSTAALTMGFSHSLVSKESACNAGDRGSIPGLGRTPGEGNGKLQKACCRNPLRLYSWKRASDWLGLGSVPTSWAG